MAKYEVTFSCGHTEMVELFDKDNNRQRKIERFESHFLEIVLHNEVMQ